VKSSTVKTAPLKLDTFSAILKTKKTVIRENNNEGSRTEKAEIPNCLIQKWRRISYNGGLFPPLNFSIIS
jgi:hypothetical protein